jgi:hypothetical protein
MARSEQLHLVVNEMLNPLLQGFIPFFTEGKSNGGRDAVRRSFIAIISAVGSKIGVAPPGAEYSVEQPRRAWSIHSLCPMTGLVLKSDGVWVGVLREGMRYMV